MNKYILLVGLLTITLAGCKNDFDLIEEGENIPVVYGFVDLSDTAQYIRVERAFADENTNALTLAQDEDAVYYDNAIVKLVNTTTNSEYVLEKVNAVDEGYTRDPGDFLVDPNILYKIPTSDIDFIGGEKIRLEVSFEDGARGTTGETTVLPAIDLSPIPNDQLGFTGRRTTVQVKADDEVGLIGMTIYLYVREALESDPSIEDTVKIRWDITSEQINNPNSTVQVVEIEPRLFFTTLRNNLDANKPVIRRFGFMEIELNSAGMETLEFRRIALANGGLTGSLELPLYSNLTDEAIGIFSSKYSALYGPYLVTNTTRDSLANGSITGDLNFRF